jgi:hypothetical protein
MSTMMVPATTAVVVIMVSSRPVAILVVTAVVMVPMRPMLPLSVSVLVLVSGARLLLTIHSSGL